MGNTGNSEEQQLRMTKFCLDFIFLSFQKLKRTPPVGLEPTTFELEVQHASPLRHGGYLLLVEELLLYRKYYITVIIISFCVSEIP